MGNKPDEDIVEEQIAYYRARASEYDSSLGIRSGQEAASGSDSPLREGLALAADLLRRHEYVDTALELACGTGVWTGILLDLADHVTAVDAAPEMLAIARAKHGDERISYVQADLFQWEPEDRYDLVFFGFWLSHVPPESLDPFLATVARAVAQGGRLVIVDQFAPLAGDVSAATGDYLAVRPLQDGRTFTIVKVFYSLDLLRENLEGLGFSVEVRKINDTFYFLSAVAPR